MSTACGRPQRGSGVRPMWTHLDRGSQKSDFCGRHKWMAPYRANIAVRRSVFELRFAIKQDASNL